MTQIFSPPDESEFFERGFGLSAMHTPDECVISFVRSYADGNELTLTFEVGSITTLHVSLERLSKVLTEITAESVADVSFQSWHGERTIRCGFSLHSVAMDLRIHYDPAASIHFSALSKYD
ncbi:hypothetical protein [Duganella sp. S19_KUP01_CR8]|uniref:hypothetical protein n=1 Tax=Duganella sp. S19_KUP01_CR8 TaxID=3025502 RepID=UPI002FCD9713